MRKVYHLEKDGKHSYYGSLQAVFVANKDLGVSKGKLDRYDFTEPFENGTIKLRVGSLLSARQAIKIVFIRELKKGNKFKFNDIIYTVKQKFSDWKKDDEPYLVTICGKVFYHDELEVELIV